MSKEHKITKIFAIALAVIIIGSIINVVLSIVINISGYNKINAYYNKYDNLTELKIDASTSKVIIKEGDEFVVFVDNATNKLKISENDGKLKVEDNKFSLSKKNTSIITITLPTQLDKINIEIGAGTLECSSIIANDFELELGAGKVNLSDVYFNETKIEGGAGEISIDNSTLNNLKFDAGTGKVTIDGKITGDSKIDSGIGEINLDLIGNDYNFILEKGIGKITINGNDLTNNTSLGDGLNKIKLKSGIGNIYINTKE